MIGRAQRVAMSFAIAACGGGDAQPPDASMDAGDAADASPDGSSVTCSPLPTPPILMPASAASGTRLAVRNIAEPVTGGVEIPFAVHDTQLDIDCEPLPYSDGTIRCVPVWGDVEKIFYKQYADPGLTTLLLMAPIFAPPTIGKLAMHTVAQWPTIWPTGPFDCHPVGIPILARIGAQRNVSVYYDELAVSHPVPAGFAMFDLNVIASDFVEVTEVRTQLSASMAARELHGTDGSRLFATELYDPAHDVVVDVVDDGSTARLMPPAFSQSHYSHRTPPPGVAVGQPVDLSWCGAPEQGLFDAAYEPLHRHHDCSGAALTFISDAQHTATYRVTQGQAKLYGCRLVEGPPRVEESPPLYEYLEACHAEPLTSWTAAQRTPLGAGRLTMPAYLIEGVPYAWTDAGWFKSRSFVDTTLNINCVPTRAADGALRCLPIGRAAVAYRNSGCSVRVALALDASTPRYAAQGSLPSDYPSELLGDVRIYNVGAQRAPERVFVRNSEGVCTEAFPLEPTYDLGAEVPASAFVALELRGVP